MLIRYSSQTGEIEVTGTSEDLLNITSGLMRGEGEVKADNKGSPEPYGQFLRAVVITNASGKRVSLQATREGNLSIEGECARLEILARVLREFVERGASDEHLHVEYFADHFYLAPNSAPTVFAWLSNH